jgi:hypothetical protein
MACNPFADSGNGIASVFTNISRSASSANAYLRPGGRVAEAWVRPGETLMPGASDWLGVRGPRQETKVVSGIPTAGQSRSSTQEARQGAGSLGVAQ